MLGGLWCPSIRGGSVDGAHGDGGLRRSIPDSVVYVGDVGSVRGWFLLGGLSVHIHSYGVFHSR